MIFHILAKFVTGMTPPPGATCFKRSDLSFKCVCLPCDEEKVDAICGSDGLTYASLCHLNLYNCKHKKAVTVSKNGACGKFMYHFIRNQSVLICHFILILIDLIHKLLFKYLLISILPQKRI